jgi:predicted nucleic-acid-binding protein
MRANIDTNILVRAVVQSVEDAEQNRIVADLFKKAAEIVIPTHVFCELVWVLSGYGYKSKEIQNGIIAILNLKKVLVKDDEVQAGLEMMEMGGDFADGVNEYVGRKMQEASIFVSFDKKAIKILAAHGMSALVPE